MSTQRTAQELAAEAQRVLEVLRQRYADMNSPPDPGWAILSRHLAALASQAEPVAKFCTYCNKHDHSDSECWSTRPVDWQRPVHSVVAQRMIAAATPAPAQAEQNSSELDIRFVVGGRIYGRPTLHDVLDYIERRGEAIHCSCDRCSKFISAQAEPSMADALAAGDGTLHGAVDYWQQRASEDGRRIDAWASNPMWRLNRWAGKWSISTPDSALTDWLGSPREAIDAAIAAKEQS